jgi:hypothetical protein
VQISMFGGLDSTNAAPVPVVFHETWVFDGKHWTHRQDVGPGPRWGHAMAYDSARRSIVLFGGLPIFRPQGDAALPERLLGDTWEHVETDLAPVPPQPQAVDVTAISLFPGSTYVGNHVGITITLNAPAPAGTQIFLGWLAKAVFDQKTADGTLTQSDVTALPQLEFPAGATTANTVFAAPALAEPVTVVAEGVGSGLMANATLIIS